MQTAKGAESWNSQPGTMLGSLNVPSTASTVARSAVVVISIVFSLFFMDTPPVDCRVFPAVCFLDYIQSIPDCQPILIKG